MLFALARDMFCARTSLLYIRSKIGLPTTDLPLEQEDEEGKEIEGCDDGKQKDTLLPSLGRLEPEDYEQAAGRNISR